MASSCVCGCMWNVYVDILANIPHFPELRRMLALWQCCVVQFIERFISFVVNVA
jgi:hypothetical protein